MKIKTYILSIGVACILLSGGTFATTIAPSQRSININNRSYTLDVCDGTAVDALRIKMIVGLKGSTLQKKKRIYTQFKLLQAAWAKSCVGASVSTTPANNAFAIVTNPDFLNGLSASERQTAQERSQLYITSTEGTVDGMISQGILNSSDKAAIKGKVEITYVDDCKKIDGLTSVKQWYDGNKKRIKNDLISVSLNVSTCAEKNFNDLFSTSYKHVFIHELGHYIYYLKDTDTQSFEDICRSETGKKKMSCLSYNTFYSKYAMTDAQEDYAESFAYWYQSKDPDFDMNISTDLTTINLKAEHFSDLFKK